MKNAKLKIYILGFIPKRITGIVLRKFLNAQLELERYEYTVYNPIINFIDPKLSREEAYRQCLKELISSDAVYLIFDSSPQMRTNEELKIALKSNKFILHQTLVIEDSNVEDENLNKLKAKLKHHSRKYVS